MTGGRDVLRWRGRQFWCRTCGQWVSVPRDESFTGQRRVHVEEHTAEAVMFARLDLLELDAMMDGFYGEGS